MSNEFSLALGLLDFVNPIMYACFFIYTFKRIRPYLKKGFYIPYVIGGILSLSCGILIPTGKCLIGLGFLTFTLPVKLVAFVNTGFILSGFSLFIGTCKKNILDPNAPEAAAADNKDVTLRSIINPYSIINSIVVLGGATGLILVYVSYMKLALKKGRKAAFFILLYSLVMTLANSFVGSAMDVSAAWVHWIIEIIAVTAHSALFISVLVLFKEKKDTAEA